MWVLVSLRWLMVGRCLLPLGFQLGFVVLLFAVGRCGLLRV